MPKIARIFAVGFLQGHRSDRRESLREGPRGVRNLPENIAAVFEAWEMPLEKFLARIGRFTPPASILIK